MKLSIKPPFSITLQFMREKKKKERLSVAYDEQDEYQVSLNFVQLLREKLTHNGNIHQVPFSDDKMREREKKKKVNWRTIVRNTCMKLNCSINLHLRFYKMSVWTDRQCRSRSDCTTR